MEKMIEFRFQIAGGSKHPFTNDALDELFRFSLGLPREVCKICDMALLRAFANQSQTVTVEIIQQTADQLAIAVKEEAAEKERKQSQKQEQNSTVTITK